MKKILLTFLFASLMFVLNAQTSLLGIDFGCDYETAYSKLTEKFGSSSVSTTDGEKINVTDVVFSLEGVDIKIITLSFSNINGKYYLYSIAFNTDAMVLVYETDAQKISEFNKFAVQKCNAYAIKMNEKYKVSTLSKKIITTQPWTKFYVFNVDENVKCEISAYFKAERKLVAQSGTTFARITYTDARYKE